MPNQNNAEVRQVVHSQLRQNFAVDLILAKAASYWPNPRLRSQSPTSIVAHPGGSVRIMDRRGHGVQGPSFEGRTISAQNGGTAFHTLRRPVGAWVDAHFKRTAHNVPSETSIRACNSDPPKYANISCVPRRGDHAAIGMGWSEADPAARARGKGKLGRPSKAVNGPPRTVL